MITQLLKYWCLCLVLIESKIQCMESALNLIETYVQQAEYPCIIQKIKIKKMGEIDRKILKNEIRKKSREHIRGLLNKNVEQGPYLEEIVKKNNELEVKYAVKIPLCLAITSVFLRKDAKNESLAQKVYGVFEENYCASECINNCPIIDKCTHVINVSFKENSITCYTEIYDRCAIEKILSKTKTGNKSSQHDFKMATKNPHKDPSTSRMSTIE